MDNSIRQVWKRFMLMASAVMLAGCLDFSPGGRLIDEITVPLSGNVNLAVSYRVKADFPGFEATVITNLGRAHQRLWDDWGPAKSGNVYATPDDRIVVIGGGGGAYMFEVKQGKVPRVYSEQWPTKEDGSDWEYLGAFVLHDGGQLRFHLPNRMEEHIQLLGAGSSPYRLAFQDAPERNLPTKSDIR